MRKPASTRTCTCFISSFQRNTNESRILCIRRGLVPCSFPVCYERRKQKYLTGPTAATCPTLLGRKNQILANAPLHGRCHLSAAANCQQEAATCSCISQERIGFSYVTLQSAASSAPAGHRIGYVMRRTFQKAPQSERYNPIDHFLPLMSG